MLTLATPLAAAYVPAAEPEAAGPTSVEPPTLPVVPARPSAGPERTFAGPDGSALTVRLQTPLVYVGERALLSIDDAARRLDPALFDVAALAKEGLVGPDGEVRVIVRTELPLTLPSFRATRALGALDLVAGRVPLDDLASLGREPGVLRVYLDQRAKVQDTQSFSLIRVYDVHARTDDNGLNVTGQNVTIAIIDTGVDHTHPELGGCFGPGCKVAGGYDFVNGDAAPMDDHGHGTHVADTAAGLHGVAPGATILAYKVLSSGGWGYYSDIIAGIENATLDGADIISMSLGGPGTSDGAIAQAVDWAVDQGVVVVSAAGNSGCYGCIGEPAASLKGIAVGATTKWDDMAYFSSRGPVYDSLGRISGVKPDVSAPGMDIYAAVPNGTCSLCDPSGFLSLSGTSMATPHVSGVAALLLQDHPTWTPDDVRGALMGSGKELTQCCSGRPHDSRTLGASRIDALAADLAQLSILPGNGYLGLDISTPGTWSKDWPVTVKAIGDSAVDVALSAKHLAPTNRTSDPSIPLPNPSGSGVRTALVDAGLNASDRALNLTEGGPLAVGVGYDLTVTNITSAGSWAYLYHDGGSRSAPLYEDGTHPGRWNATFQNVTFLAGYPTVYGSDFGVDFLSGYENVAQAATPTSVHLEPGESTTATLSLGVDNGVIQDGWSDGRLSASVGNATYSARTTFLKTGIIHLNITSGTRFLFGERDGRIEVFFYSPPASYDLLASAGSWDFQAVLSNCPTGVSSCRSSSTTIAFVDDVAHVSETNVTIARPQAAPKLDVVATFVDGTTRSGASLPYCNWAPSTTGCYNWAQTFVSRADNNGWFGIEHGNYDVYLDETTWRVGREFEYSRGAESYLIGDFREGVTADWTLSRNASSFDRLDVEYQPPAGATSAMMMTGCFFTAEGISFGLSNGRKVVSATEPFYLSAHDVGRIPAGDDTIPSMPCEHVLFRHTASYNGLVGDQCWEQPGCFGAGRSDFLGHDANGFHGVETPFNRIPTVAALRPGGIVISDGSSWLDGDGYAYPRAVWIGARGGPLFDWYHWFTPASGGAQWYGENTPPGPAYRVEVDGASVIQGRLDRWGVYAGWSDVGQNVLTIEKEITRLETTNGTARFIASWNDSHEDGPIPIVVAPHATGNGGFGTSFAANETLAFHFATRGQTVSAASVRFRNMGSNQTATVQASSPGADGWYHVDVPPIGQGPIEAAVTLVATTATVTLEQTPAFVIAASTNRAPTLAVSTPTPGQAFGAPFVARGNASDPDGAADLASVEFRVDDGPWQRANGTTEWSAPIDTSPLLPGNHTFHARVTDAAGAQRNASVGFVVVKLPDLVVRSLEVVRVPIETSYGSFANDVAERRIVRAVVENRGTGPAWATSAVAVANATLYAPGTTASHRTSEPLGEVAVPALAAGANATIEWIWDTVGNVGDHDVVVRADPRSSVTETREDNNEARTRSWVVAGGLGGAALLAPIDPPSLEGPVDDIADALAFQVDRLEGASGEVQRALQGHVDNITEDVGQVVEGVADSPASTSAGIAYDFICVAPDNVHCRVLTGRMIIGGAFEFCRPGYPGAAQLGYVVQAIDRTTRDLGIGGSTCRNWSEDLFLAATIVDGQLETVLP